MSDNKLIRVKSNLTKNDDGTSKLAVWEKDPRHPKGEVLINGDKVVEVFPTAEIVAALRAEKIIETKDDLTLSPKEQRRANQKADSGASADAEKRETVKTDSDTEKEKNAAQESDLPENTPLRGRLIQQGILTIEALKKMSVNELVALRYVDAEQAETIFAFAKDLK